MSFREEIGLRMFRSFENEFLLFPAAFPGLPENAFVLIARVGLVCFVLAELPDLLAEFRFVFLFLLSFFGALGASLRFPVGLACKMEEVFLVGLVSRFVFLHA